MAQSPEGIPRQTLLRAKLCFNPPGGFSRGAAKRRENAILSSYGQRGNEGKPSFPITGDAPMNTDVLLEKLELAIRELPPTRRYEVLQFIEFLEYRDQRKDPHL
jgi:hypothetical protein